MAKVMNMDVIDGWQVAGFQLKDDLVFNKALYDVTALYPQPFKNIAIGAATEEMIAHSLTGTSDFTLNASKTALYQKPESVRVLRGRRSGNFTYGGNFMVDSQNSTIGYYISNYDPYLYKINLTTKEKVAIGANNGVNFTTRCFVGQTATHVFVMSYNTASGYYNLYCAALDKSSLGFDDVLAGNSSYRYACATYMTESASEIFVVYSESYSTSSHRLCKVDMATPDFSDAALQTSPYATLLCKSVPSQTRVIDVNTDAAYAVWPAATVGNGFEIYKYTFNKGLGTATSSICTLDFATAGVNRADVLFRPTNIGAGEIIVEAWMVTGGSSDYMCFSVAEDGAHNDEIASVFKIYVFKIGATDTNLTYIGSIDPALRIRNIMPLEDDWTKIMTVFDGGVHIYDWNSGNETYDYVDEYAADVASIMVDRLERIWILDTTDVLHMFSATTPIRITVVMEDETYNYTGSTINTYANISAWDTDGDRVAANVKLVLEGSAEFTDSSQSKTFATSASAETQQNINITGSSFSRAIASVVV